MGASKEPGIVYVERRAENVDRPARGSAWAGVLREVVSILAAAGAAYLGIRLDLVRAQVDIEHLKIQDSRLEIQIDKLREAREAVTNGRR